jgi:hypothetical protein
LTDGDREALLKFDGEIRRIERGEDILKLGDHPTHVVVVINGLLHRHTIPTGYPPVSLFLAGRPCPHSEMFAMVERDLMVLRARWPTSGAAA